MSEGLDLREGGKVNLDIKTLVGIVAMILSVAGVYFTLTGQIAQLQLDVIRMQDAVAMNSEFRIKWPRGELGALPDDAKQDLRIEYLQRDIGEAIEKMNELQEEVEAHLRSTNINN
jgi:hypothetical protein